MLLKQEWYRDYAISEGRKALAFVGRFNLNSSYEKVASDVANELGINAEFRTAASNWEVFLTNFMASAEASGILVIRSGVVASSSKRTLNTKEFRGFVLSDPIAPLVFINGADSTSAQVFTLAHELAHLWIGKSGISNPNPKKRSTDENNTIERFCNQVAAELLVPHAEFLKRWRNAENGGGDGAGWHAAFAMGDGSQGERRIILVNFFFLFHFVAICNIAAGVVDLIRFQIVDAGEAGALFFEEGGIGEGVAIDGGQRLGQGPAFVEFVGPLEDETGGAQEHGRGRAGVIEDREEGFERTIAEIVEIVAAGEQEFGAGLLDGGGESGGGLHPTIDGNAADTGVFGGAGDGGAGTQGLSNALLQRGEGG